MTDNNKHNIKVDLYIDNVYETHFAFVGVVDIKKLFNTVTSYTKLKNNHMIKISLFSRVQQDNYFMTPHLGRYSSEQICHISAMDELCTCILPVYRVNTIEHYDINHKVGYVIHIYTHNFFYCILHIIDKSHNEEYYFNVEIINNSVTYDFEKLKIKCDINQITCNNNNVIKYSLDNNVLRINDPIDRETYDIEVTEMPVIQPVILSKKELKKLKKMNNEKLK